MAQQQQYHPGQAVYRVIDGVRFPAHVIAVEGGKIVTIEFEEGRQREEGNEEELELELRYDLGAAFEHRGAYRRVYAKDSSDVSTGEPPVAVLSSNRRSKDTSDLGEARRNTMRVIHFHPLAARCEACNKWTLFRCRNCSAAYFCSFACRRSATGHAVECVKKPFIPLFTFPAPPVPEINGPFTTSVDGLGSSKHVNNSNSNSNSNKLVVPSGGGSNPIRVPSPDPDARVEEIVDTGDDNMELNLSLFDFGDDDDDDDIPPLIDFENPDPPPLVYPSYPTSSNYLTPANSPPHTSGRRAHTPPFAFNSQSLGYHDNVGDVDTRIVYGGSAEDGGGCLGAGFGLGSGDSSSDLMRDYGVDAISRAMDCLDDDGCSLTTTQHSDEGGSQTSAFASTSTSTSLVSAPGHDAGFRSLDHYSPYPNVVSHRPRFQSQSQSQSQSPSHSPSNSHSPSHSHSVGFYPITSSQSLHNDVWGGASIDDDEDLQRAIAASLEG